MAGNSLNYMIALTVEKNNSIQQLMDDLKRLQEFVSQGATFPVHVDGNLTETLRQQIDAAVTEALRRSRAGKGKGVLLPHANSSAAPAPSAAQQQQGGDDMRESIRQLSVAVNALAARFNVNPNERDGQAPTEPTRRSAYDRSANLHTNLGDYLKKLGEMSGPLSNSQAKTLFDDLRKLLANTPYKELRDDLQRAKNTFDGRARGQEFSMPERDRQARIDFAEALKKAAEGAAERAVASIQSAKKPSPAPAPAVDALTGSPGAKASFANIGKAIASAVSEELRKVLADLTRPADSDRSRTPSSFDVKVDGYGSAASPAEVATATGVLRGTEAQRSRAEYDRLMARVNAALASNNSRQAEEYLTQARRLADSMSGRPSDFGQQPGQAPSKVMNSGVSQVSGGVAYIAQRRNKKEAVQRVQEEAQWVEKVLSEQKRIGLDIETGMTKGPDGKSVATGVRTIQIGLEKAVDGVQAIVLDVERMSKDAVKRILQAVGSEDITKIGHNLTFDQRQLQSTFGIGLGRNVQDTMIQERALYRASGKSGDIPQGTTTLQALAKNYLGLELSKDEQTGFSLDGSRLLRDRQVRYAGVDAVLPLLIAEAQRKQLLQVSADRRGSLQQYFDRAGAIVPGLAQSERNLDQLGAFELGYFRQNRSLDDLINAFGATQTPTMPRAAAALDGTTDDRVRRRISSAALWYGTQSPDVAAVMQQAYSTGFAGLPVRRDASQAVSQTVSNLVSQFPLNAVGPYAENPVQAANEQAKRIQEEMRKLEAMGLASMNSGAAVLPPTAARALENVLLRRANLEARVRRGETLRFDETQELSGLSDENLSRQYPVVDALPGQSIGAKLRALRNANVLAAAGTLNRGGERSIEMPDSGRELLSPFVLDRWQQAGVPEDVVAMANQYMQEQAKRRNLTFYQQTSNRQSAIQRQLIGGEQLIHSLKFGGQVPDEMLPLITRMDEAMKGLPSITADMTDAQRLQVKAQRQKEMESLWSNPEFSRVLQYMGSGVIPPSSRLSKISSGQYADVLQGLETRQAMWLQEQEQGGVWGTPTDAIVQRRGYVLNGVPMLTTSREMGIDPTTNKKQLLVDPAQISLATPQLSAPMGGTATPSAQAVLDYLRGVSSQYALAEGGSQYRNLATGEMLDRVTSVLRQRRGDPAYAGNPAALELGNSVDQIVRDTLSNQLKPRTDYRNTAGEVTTATDEIFQQIVKSALNMKRQLEAAGWKVVEGQGLTLPSKDGRTAGTTDIFLANDRGQIGVIDVKTSRDGQRLAEKMGPGGSYTQQVNAYADMASGLTGLPATFTGFLPYILQYAKDQAVITGVNAQPLTQVARTAGASGFGGQVPPVPPGGTPPGLGGPGGLPWSSNGEPLPVRVTNWAEAPFASAAGATAGMEGAFGGTGRPPKTQIKPGLLADKAQYELERAWGRGELARVQASEEIRMAREKAQALAQIRSEEALLRGDVKKTLRTPPSEELQRRLQEMVAGMPTGISEEQYKKYPGLLEKNTNRAVDDLLRAVRDRQIAGRALSEAVSPEDTRARFEVLGRTESKEERMRLMAAQLLSLDPTLAPQSSKQLKEFVPLAQRFATARAGLTYYGEIESQREDLLGVNQDRRRQLEQATVLQNEIAVLKSQLTEARKREGIGTPVGYEFSALAADKAYVAEMQRQGKDRADNFQVARDALANNPKTARFSKVFTPLAKTFDISDQNIQRLVGLLDMGGKVNVDAAYQLLSQLETAPQQINTLYKSLTPGTTFDAFKGQYTPLAQAFGYDQKSITRNLDEVRLAGQPNLIDVDAARKRLNMLMGDENMRLEGFRRTAEEAQRRVEDSQRVAPKTVKEYESQIESRSAQLRETLGVSTDNGAVQRMARLQLAINLVEKKLQDVGKVSEKVFEKMSKDLGVDIKNVEQLREELAKLTAEYDKQAQVVDGAAIGNAGTRSSSAGGGRNIGESFLSKVMSLSQYTMAGSVVYTFANVVRNTTRAVIGFESDLKRIQGILDTRSAEAASFIGTQVRENAETFGVGIAEPLRAARVFAQIGAGPEEISRLTRAAVVAQQGAGLEPQQASELLIATRNISNQRVQPEDVTDRIAAVEAKYAVGAQDLSEAIQRVGSLATQLQPQMLGSVDAFDTVIGATTAIVERTRISGNQAATALRFILSRLTAPEVARDLQRRFQIQLASGEPDDNGVVGNRMRPMMDILSSISRRYEELRGSGQTVKAQELLTTFAGARQANVAAALLGDFDSVLQTATESALSFGDAQERAFMQLDTVTGRQQQLASSFQGLATVVADSTGALTLWKKIVQAATAGVQTTTSAFEEPGVGGIIGTGVVAAGGYGLRKAAPSLATRGIGKIAGTAAATAETGIAARAVAGLTGLLSGLGTLALVAGSAAALIKAFDELRYAIPGTAFDPLRVRGEVSPEMRREFMDRANTEGARFGVTGSVLTEAGRTAFQEAVKRYGEENYRDLTDTTRTDEQLAQDAKAFQTILREELSKELPEFARLSDDSTALSEAFAILRITTQELNLESDQRLRDARQSRDNMLTNLEKRGSLSDLMDDVRLTPGRNGPLWNVDAFGLKGTDGSPNFETRVTGILDNLFKTKGVNLAPAFGRDQFIFDGQAMTLTQRAQQRLTEDPNMAPVTAMTETIREVIALPPRLQSMYEQSYNRMMEANLREQGSGATPASIAPDIEDVLRDIQFTAPESLTLQNREMLRRYDQLAQDIGRNFADRAQLENVPEEEARTSGVLADLRSLQELVYSTTQRSIDQRIRAEQIAGRGETATQLRDLFAQFSREDVRSSAFANVQQLSSERANIRARFAQPFINYGMRQADIETMTMLSEQGFGGNPQLEQVNAMRQLAMDLGRVAPQMRGERMMRLLSLTSRIRDTQNAVGDPVDTAVQPGESFLEYSARVQAPRRMSNSMMTFYGSTGFMAGLPQPWSPLAQFDDSVASPLNPMAPGTPRAAGAGTGRLAPSFSMSEMIEGMADMPQMSADRSRLGPLFSVGGEGAISSAEVGSQIAMLENQQRVINDVLTNFPRLFDDPAGANLSGALVGIRDQMVDLVTNSKEISGILAVPVPQRTKEQTDKVRQWWQSLLSSQQEMGGVMRQVTRRSGELNEPIVEAQMQALRRQQGLFSTQLRGQRSVSAAVMQGEQEAVRLELRGLLGDIPGTREAAFEARTRAAQENYNVARANQDRYLREVDQLPDGSVRKKDDGTDFTADELRRQRNTFNLRLNQQTEAARQARDSELNNIRNERARLASEEAIRQTRLREANDRSERMRLAQSAVTQQNLLGTLAQQQLNQGFAAQAAGFRRRGLTGMAAQTELEAGLAGVADIRRRLERDLSLVPLRARGGAAEAPGREGSLERQAYEGQVRLAQGELIDQYSARMSELADQFDRMAQAEQERIDSSKRQQFDSFMQDGLSGLREVLLDFNKLKNQPLPTIIGSISQAWQTRRVDMFMDSLFGPMGALTDKLFDAFDQGGSYVYSEIYDGHVQGMREAAATFRTQLEVALKSIQPPVSTPGAPAWWNQTYQINNERTNSGNTNPVTISSSALYGEPVARFASADTTIEMIAAALANADGTDTPGQTRTGNRTSPQGPTPRQKWKRVGENAAVLGAGYLGTWAGGQLRGGADYASEGANFGQMLGSPFGVPGMIIGSLAGGLLGGLFKKKEDKPEAQIAALEKIERNTRQQVEVLESQTSLLKLDSRFLNVGAGFTVPQFRPYGVGGGGGASIGDITVNVTTSSSASAKDIGQEVARAIQGQLSQAGLAFDTRTM